jgi:phospholipase/carboxylesterase/glyoxalase family protein
MKTDDLGFIHRYIPAQGNDRRVLLLLHGTGGNETSLLSLGQELAPGAALLSPRGKILERGAPRFFRRLAEGVFDIADLHFRTAELAEFVRRAAERYEFDPGEVILVGYSNGANIAASLLLAEPAIARAAVLFRAMVPFEPGTLPDRGGTAVYMAAGTVDSMIGTELVERLAEILRATGAEVEVQWKETGHGLLPEECTEARVWLERITNV